MESSGSGVAVVRQAESMMLSAIITAKVYKILEIIA
jgi:hypothetical protein